MSVDSVFLERIKKLEATTLSRTTGEGKVLDVPALTLNRGELTILVGPNGSGKSSLLMALMGFADTTGSRTLIMSQSTDTPHALSALTLKERARILAYLPQNPVIEWPISTRALVGLGRFAQGGATGKSTTEETACVDAALAACNLSALAGRPVDRLSGGELMRAHCARMLVSKAPFLFADEPLTSLDPAHQRSMLHLFKGAAEAGTGVLLTLHDVSLAARFADRLIILHHGQIMADGPPGESLDSDVLKDVFGLSVEILSSRNGTPIVHFTDDPATP